MDNHWLQLELDVGLHFNIECVHFAWLGFSKSEFWIWNLKWWFDFMWQYGFVLKYDSVWDDDDMISYVIS